MKLTTPTRAVYIASIVLSILSLLLVPYQMYWFGEEWINIWTVIIEIILIIKLLMSISVLRGKTAANTLLTVAAVGENIIIVICMLWAFIFWLQSSSMSALDGFFGGVVMLLGMMGLALFFAVLFICSLVSFVGEKVKAK
jgi:hypothetical protein